MWFGGEKHKALVEYIRPYANYGDTTVKNDKNTVAIVNSLFRNDIGTIEQLKALTDEDIDKLSYVGKVRADIIRRARDGVDPTIMTDFAAVKTRAIEYKLPFKTSDEFVEWRDKADNDFVDACDTCPIANICKLSCSVETALTDMLEISDETIGCAAMYDILLEKFGKEGE